MFLRVKKNLQVLFKRKLRLRLADRTDWKILTQGSKVHIQMPNTITRTKNICIKETSQSQKTILTPRKIMVTSTKSKMEAMSGYQK